MCDSCWCFRCLFAVAAGSMIQVRSDDLHWNLFGWSTGEHHVQLLAREANTRSVSRAAPGAPLDPCTGLNLDSPFGENQTALGACPYGVDSVRAGLSCFRSVGRQAHGGSRGSEAMAAGAQRLARTVSWR